ncbi:ABC transporter permease [Salipaludibacillus keqinensis]|uniref:ABC transporter permease n=1 Tax=Salipaludibacillus keqinensis TaxID=2045207 RepID=A0A323T9B5_9BACI|nr:ABC transporter permease [Salipaludibacillus keqinensis]PYZ92302.1 ABC transporter permease [Salipaludibacillus keqinensis]
MNNFLTLTVGELQRMNKYQILPSSLFVVAFWIAFLYFVDALFINQLFAMLIFVDASIMSIILVGAIMFFEKHEGTFRTFMVTPIRKSDYILSKAFAIVVSNLITVLILFAFAYYVKNIEMNLLAFVGAVCLVGLFHAILGFWMSFYAKDFTSLIMRSTGYMLIFVLPVILVQLQVIQHDWFQYILYIVPTQASMNVLNASAGLPVETSELWWSTIFLIGLIIVIFFVTLKKFDEFSQKEGGQ